MAFNPVLNLGDLNGRNGFVIKGLDISLGWSVSNAGDVNADGLDDVILSGSGEQDYVIFGSSQDFGISFDVSDIDGSNGFVIEKRDDSFLSWSVSGAGDVNGDGKLFHI
ncbi:MAG: hypothetical protein AAFO04_05480 [Cyanobacteria bacterium J06592_8]